ncbi:uncharacterized transmembrane protein DDB_G0289901 isoform X2 [Oreochromis niloticus]|uniref:uncharacterized transmembrane protein DDB_G0289901 isoform X2 n=1 Tax=Oreochromis niloticus TaxID=8128 RepID=UPI0003940D7E|nr:uncharacterized transmembrane protein DDB_G0289901 isoform X2 [Oreochromis niloticus]
MLLLELGMGLELVLKVSWICFLLFSSGSCFPVTLKGQTSPDVTASTRSAGTNPGHENDTGREVDSAPGTNGSTGGEVGSGLGPNGSTGGQLDSGPDSSPGGEVGCCSSAGGWSFVPGSSNGGGVGPGSRPDGSTGGGVGPGNSKGGWSFSPGSSTRGGVSPGSSGGSWSFSPGSSTGVGVGPSSSAGGWSFGPGSSSGGWVGPSSSPGGWSFALGGPIGEVRPTWANGYAFLGGVPYQNYPPVSSFLYHPWNWIPPRPFPDFNAWSTYEVPLGMVVLPPQVPSLPSSHLVQAGTGYQRGREVLSHSKYSNNVLGHHPLSPVLPHYPRSASGFQGETEEPVSAFKKPFGYGIKTS